MAHSQALLGCRVSAYLHGQRGLNPQLEQGYQDWWCWEIAHRYPTKSGRQPGWEETRQKPCCPHPPPILSLRNEEGSAAWLASWEHHARPYCLLPSNGNSCYGLPAPSAFLYKANNCKERFPLTWTSSLCTQQQWLQVGVNSVMLTCLSGDCWVVFLPLGFTSSSSLIALEYQHITVELRSTIWLLIA